MSSKGLEFTLLLGSSVPRPAPKELLLAFREANVQVSDAGPIRFQICFRADGAAKWAAKNPIVSHTLLQPFTRVAILVTVGMSPTVLVDGYITHQQFDPGGAQGEAMFTVSGEDVSVLMAVEEKCSEFTGLDEAGIVRKILLSYLAHGLTGSVKAPKYSDSPLPSRQTRMQRGTDRAYIQHLARQAGFVTYVETGASPGLNTFYFGPPSRSGATQDAIVVSRNTYANATDVSFELDARAATKASASFLTNDTSGSEPEKVDISTSTLDALSARPALTALGSNLRTTLVDHGGASLAKVKQLAQGTVDRSVQAVATATGTLHVSRYGKVLQPRRLVELKGGTDAFDGKWYVSGVKHVLSHSGYTQRFTLAREGLGRKSTGL